jgi:hypothetical protein
MNRLSILLFALVLVSCGSLKTTVDYDKSVDFGKYKTYGFSAEANQLPVNDLVRKRIFDAIHSALQSKGLKEAEKPNLLVDLGVKTEEKQQTSANSVNMGGFYGRRWGFGTGFSTTQVNTTNYTEGTLVINLVDAAKQELVWMGSGTATVTEKSIQQDKIEAAVTKILAKFPPAPKK